MADFQGMTHGAQPSPVNVASQSATPSAGSQGMYDTVMSYLYDSKYIVALIIVVVVGYFAYNYCVKGKMPFSCCDMMPTMSPLIETNKCKKERQEKGKDEVDLSEI